MIKKSFIFFPLFFTTFILSFSAQSAEYFNTERKTGTVNLIPVKMETSPDRFFVQLGKRVKGKFFLYHEIVHGNKHVVNGNAEFKNNSEQNVFVAYYVALKNKNGQLIAATSGDLELGLDNNIHQFASAIMPIPKNQFSSISHYEITLYESTKSIGAD